MKKSTHKSGVITVLVALLLTGILSLGTLVLEAGRFQAAKTQLAEANISAGTSMLASYNAELYSRYGLLAIDNQAANVGKYRNYLEFNSDLAAGYKGNNLATFYKIDAVEMEGLYNLTYPSVLKRQIQSRAKHNIAWDENSFNQYNMDYFFSDLQNKAEYVRDAFRTSERLALESEVTFDGVPEEMMAALQSMQTVFSDIKKYDPECDVTLNSSTVSILPSITGVNEQQAPEEDIKAIQDTLTDAKTILGAEATLLETNADPTYSENDFFLNVSYMTTIPTGVSDIESMRRNADALAFNGYYMASRMCAFMDLLNEDKDGNMLLNTYIANYFPCRNYIVENYHGPAKGTVQGASMDNGTFSSACVEYIFGGNASEKVNQEKAYDYVAAVRFINNLYATVINSQSFDNNSLGSMAAHIAWAYYETCVDMELLAKYNATVPLGKYNMILPIDNPSRVKDAFSSGDFLNAMRMLGIGIVENETMTFVVEGTDQTNYRDALALALWFVPNTDKMYRVADLIQMEMRYYEQHVQNKTATFMMSEQNTFCRVKCNAKLNSILPIISLGTNSGVNGISFQNIRYVGY